MYGPGNKQCSFVENHMPNDALDITQKDPHPPASSHLELLWDVGTFFMLVLTLFGKQYDYFQNLFDLWTMLD